MLYKLIRKILPNKLIRLLDFNYLYNQFTYRKDGLYTLHNCNFIEDADFKKSYLAGKSTGSWGNHDIEWRTHIVLWYAKYAFQFDGDFVECGVNKGGLSRAIVEYLNFNDVNKSFFLFDTFAGFDFSLLLENEKDKYSGVVHYGDTYEYVKSVFQDFPFVQVIKGSVPQTLTNVEIRKVSFLSIDMNCVLPELAALDFFLAQNDKRGCYYT
jgi:O-methyltransferase